MLLNAQLGQFYTSRPFGRLLVESITTDSPKTVLDLGVGEGALFSEAHSRWGGATLISVDVDKYNHISIQDRYPEHIHICSDAIADELAAPLQPYRGMVDVAICNPPYVRTAWKNSFGSILEEAGLSGVIPRLRDAAADLIFLAQNLRMLRMGGELGIIVPDGVITSQRYRLLRKTILERFSLKSIIQLPRGVFHGTDVRAFILTLEKKGPIKETVELYSANEDGVLGFPIQVNHERGIERLDYDFHAWQKENFSIQLSRDVSLTEIAEINRGAIDNASAQKNNISVFHTTNFKEIGNLNYCVIPERLQASKHSLSEYLVAESGDIILARVGRSLESQLAYIRRGKVVLTDCVYRIRVNPAMRQVVWDALTSADGQAWIRAHMKGTGARVISKKDLQNFRLSKSRV